MHRVRGAIVDGNFTPIGECLSTVKNRRKRVSVHRRGGIKRLWQIIFRCIGTTTASTWWRRQPTPGCFGQWWQHYAAPPQTLPLKRRWWEEWPPPGGWTSPARDQQGAEAVAVGHPLGVQLCIHRHCRILLRVAQLLGRHCYVATFSTRNYSDVPSCRARMML
jgi:hypothetical protein